MFPMNTWATSTLATHRRRGFKVTLTLKELLDLARDKKSCPICSTKLDWTTGTKDRKIKSNSPTLDRKNNEDFLSKENAQIICHGCNAGKRTLTMEQFIAKR